jgi:hypothetical protein
MESDSQGGTMIVGEQLKALPDELGLIIGDALQTMRSSLDNLAFALAVENNPNMTPDQEEKVSFPIFNQPTTPAHASVNQMDSVVRTRVIELCPDPADSPIQEHPLWLLHKSNNRDKHREITVASLQVVNQSVTITGGTITGGTSISTGAPQRTKEPGDKVVLMRLGPGSKMSGNVNVGVQIVFGEGLELEDREVIATLRWFHGHIMNTVFPALESYL